MQSESFRDLPFMGVIRVNDDAGEFGYVPGDPDWCNLGQGMPEVGDIPGAPPRFSQVNIEHADHAYGPVEGLPELREAVAAHYNRLYRGGVASQYSAENVMITPGGRVGLSRCGVALDDVRLGHFTPDYTAYEDLLRTFDQVKTHRIDLSIDEGFKISPARLTEIVEQEGLNTLLISNPCNPTGVVVRGAELNAWLDLCRRKSCTLLLDEFYSHFVFNNETPGPVSGAQFVEDVDRDPVVIFDGLTKSFRYPGWRIGWILGPRAVIRNMTAAGSFLDGGPSRPIQRAAIEVLEPGRADGETDAVRQEFAIKQRITIDRLRAMGIHVTHDPESTFYAFGDISGLPAPINEGVAFMREAFKSKVLTVPGAYFDVDPRKDRPNGAMYRSFIRFSFGLPRADLEIGLDRLASMVAEAGFALPTHGDRSGPVGAPSV